jgi:hypothetical protein
LTTSWVNAEKSKQLKPGGKPSGFFFFTAKPFQKRDLYTKRIVHGMMGNKTCLVPAKKYEGQKGKMIYWLDYQAAIYGY